MELTWMHRTRFPFQLRDVDHPIVDRALNLGFSYHRGNLSTDDPLKALNFRDYANPAAELALMPFVLRLNRSTALQPSRAFEQMQTIFPKGVDPYPHQMAAVQYGAQNRVTILGDEPGCGKTISAIGLLNLDCLNALVICPSGLRLCWERELQKWSLNSSTIQVVNTQMDRLTPGRTLILSYDMARRRYDELMKMSFDGIVLDEFQFLKNPLSLRGLAVFGNPKQHGLIYKKRRIILLSGTPITNRVDDIYYVLKYTSPPTLSGITYEQFLKRYCIYKHMGLGEYKILGGKNLDDLYARLRSTCMVRRSLQEVLQWLPPQTLREVPINVEHPEEFQDINPASRRLLGVAKVQSALEHIRTILASQQKVVVFAFHREVIQALEKGLQEYGLVLIDGSTSLAKRQAAVDTFQQDPACRVFLGNTIAAGTGNTLTASTRVVLVEPSWSPFEDEQAGHRVFRIGQTLPSQVDCLLAAGTSDETVSKVASSKFEDARRVTDGRKEVQKTIKTVEAIEFDSLI